VVGERWGLIKSEKEERESKTKPKECEGVGTIEDTSRTVENEERERERCGRPY